MSSALPQPLERPYLHVTDLKQWAYCPRVVYYRFCLPRIRPLTYSMQAGVQAHEEATSREERRSLRAYGLAAGERFFDVALTSEQLHLTARIDLVIRTQTAQGEEGIVVDYKLSERQAGSHFKLQLAAYALMLEEAWGIPVRRAFLYHIPQRQAEAIPITVSLRQKVETTIEAIHKTIVGEVMPRPPATLGPCVSCEFRRFCNDVV
ncbi:MAG TPA: CRISPR-associated protein Cas4 [Ktedonobacterales bacterium]|nr:CRISPR-associated protein Cas4 [Ktedonobacterales bacterium]